MCLSCCSYRYVIADGERAAEKLGAELSVTWLLHLIVVEAVFDAEGGSLKIRIFGRTPEEWRALLDKVKRKKRKKGKAESSEAGGKKQKSTAKGAKRIPEEPPVKTGQSRQNSGGETGNFAGHKFSWNGSIQACENPDVRAKFCR